MCHCKILGHHEPPAELHCNLVVMFLEEMKTIFLKYFVMIVMDSAISDFTSESPINV